MGIKTSTFLKIFTVTAFGLAACTAGIGSLPAGKTDPALVTEPAKVPDESGQPEIAEQPEAEDLQVADRGAESEGSSQDVESNNAGFETTGAEQGLELLDPEEPPPSGAEFQFSTNFSIHSVPYSEILSGGPPKDGIPAVDDPKFVPVEDAGEWLDPLEPVLLIQVGEEARAYPVQILMYHEIVNDLVGDLPVTVTFCPLCNTGIAFERKVDGEVLDFGTTGRLRFSNLIMYDRQTETWWQQASGQAIAGELTGKTLTFLPVSMVSWEQFKESFPDGQVLSRDTGFQRQYGRNPYAGYDNINNPPFLYRGPATPGELPAVARVLTIDTGEEAAAYPYEILAEVKAVNDTIGGQDVAVFWQEGTASALDDNSVAGGRDIGAASAFSREVGGRTLTFSHDGEKIVDDQTGSEWNLLGTAVSGELEGTRLKPVVAINHFWFSWAAFKPETRIYQP